MADTEKTLAVDVYAVVHLQRDADAHHLGSTSGHGRKFVGGLGLGGGVCEVEAAGGVEGVFG
jgi:hypothetical protein